MSIGLRHRVQERILNVSWRCCNFPTEYEKQGGNAMPSSRTISANGLDFFVVEQGQGPLVLLCHGWPELSYSWRHQIPAIAEAGFRVVAPDMRGFGRTSAPADVGDYTIFHNVGDMVALVAALGEKQAVIVGHDWGRRSPGTRRCSGPMSSPGSRASAFRRLPAGAACRWRPCGTTASPISTGSIFRLPA